MLFNSYEFIFLFLPLTFFVYFILNKKRLITLSKSWLVLTSLCFYAWWNVSYLPLILISVLVNFSLSLTMLNYDKYKKIYFSKKFIFIAGLVFNVALLGYFKYMDFFIGNVNFLFGFNVELLHIILPLAISFFTLQQVAYLVDAYEDLVQERNFLDYILFVSFFPQLISGPIVHHSEMMPQFNKLKNKIVNFNNIICGIFIFSLGLFKKVVIADTFALWATHGFSNSENITFLDSWVTSLSYTFQLYYDFSGYTDMAIGAALLFNIVLPINFNSPFKSLSIIEFWQRWHMTLTRFITTYMYTAMLKSFDKVTFNKAMAVTFFTMTIAGIWHGAAWTIMLFGMLHGLALVINHIWRKQKIKTNKFLAWFLTFNLVNISFVLFRAESYENAKDIIFGMFNILTFGLDDFDIQITLMIIAAFIVVFAFKNSIELIAKFKFSIYTLFWTIFMMFFSIILLSRPSEFIYFNF